ncbi:MAG: HD domain-containing phosphohydrolase [Elusimicrobiota bacterium]|jgi:hypothetical protein
MSESSSQALPNAATALELFSIAGSLSSTLDLDYLLEKIGLAAERLLDSEASSIMLVTDDKKSLYFKVAGGEAGAKLKRMNLPIGQGIAGWVAQHRKPEVVVDTAKDPRFAGRFDKASGFITRSLLAVPMVFRGEIVGVAEVLNKRNGSYTPEDVTLLSSLANLASVAITNARIVQDQQNFFSHVLELLAASIESSRPGMQGHPHRSARLACALARSMGIADYEYRMIYYAGMLHDIGFVAFRNPRLLAEVGISTPVYEQHPILSMKMLEGIHMLEGALPIVHHHHEAYDGSGFPGRLAKDAIPMGARILAVVEVLEDLRMAGLDGAALIERGRKELQAGRGTRFDPEVVDAAMEILDGSGLW